MCMFGNNHWCKFSISLQLVYIFITDSLGQECRIYKTLETPERRITAKQRAKPLSDDILKDNTWYRITAAAGNQVPENCVKTGCSSLYKGWINGSLPTVDEGQLEREMCFSSNTNGCCKPSKEVRVRNCGGYYVFKFPALTVTEMKFCSSYKHRQYCYLTQFSFICNLFTSRSPDNDASNHCNRLSVVSRNNICKDYSGVNRHIMSDNVF